MTERTWRLAAACILTIAIWVAGVAAQVPAPDEFVPVAPGEVQEQLPAAPLVFAAYGIVWLIFAFYLFSVWTRVKQVESELREVAAKLERGGR